MYSKTYILLLFVFIYGTFGTVTFPSPVRGVVRTFETIDWSNSQDIVHFVDQGFNLVILSYLNPTDTSVSYDGCLYWDTNLGGSDGQKLAMQQIHSKGAMVTASVRLYPSTYKLNPVDVATVAANWVKSRYMDGIDYFPNEIGSDFYAGGLNAQYLVQWFKNLTLTTRQILGPNLAITFSPQAVWFGPINATTGPGVSGGFCGVYNAVNGDIDFFNIVYFYQLACYQDYTSIFQQSTNCAPTSITEISNLCNIPRSKLTVVKTTSVDPSYSYGYMDASTLHSILVTAGSNIGYNNGAIAFMTSNTTSTLQWEQSVFQPANPGVPSVTTSPGGTKIDLSWSGFDGFSKITNYVVTRNGNTVYSGLSTSFTDQGLTMSTSYVYTVASTNAIGSSTPSVITVSTIAPAIAPPPPTRTTYNTTSVTLVWSPPANNGGGYITSYLLKRNQEPIYNGKATSFTDTGLKPGTAQSYTVAAYNNAGVSPDSAIGVIYTNYTTPETPSEPTASSSTYNSITVAWDAPDNNGADITMYQLIRDGVPVYNGPETMYTDTGLDVATIYEYMVAASNIAGSGEFSDPADLATGNVQCNRGYHVNDDGGCSMDSGLVAAIVAPILLLLIISALVGYIIYRRKRYTQSQKLKSSSLLPSMSTIALESEYLSTNLITPWDSIKIVRRLGTGGSGVVYIAVWRNIEVAVKEYKDQNIQTNDFIRESEIHAKLRHPNVVQLLAICLPPHLCAVSEFMGKGSLTDVLEQQPAELTWKVKCQILLDIARGMDYLHKSRIIHRDLKSQNCLVDKNWCCKIADFGTSKFLIEDATATVYVPRTAQWTAPEVITQNMYSEKSDVYSFGIILWEVLTGKIPYDGMFAYQVEDRTVHGARLTVPVGCESWYEALMKECWHSEANERPSFEQIINCLTTTPTTTTTPTGALVTDLGITTTAPSSS